MRKIYLLLIASLFAVTGMKAQCPLTTAVDFTATDCHGETFNLFDVLDGGQHVLIDFFFVNCGPCQQATPKISEAYTILGCNMHDVFFIEISCEDSNAACLTWVANYGIEYPTISGIEGGGAAICNTYGIPAYPTIILIAPDRSIVIQDLWPISNAQTIVNAVAPYGVLPHECGAPLAMPNNLDYAVEEYTVTLTWDEPDDMTDFTGYNVYKDDVKVAENISDKTFTEVVAAGNYKYCVSAVFATGESNKTCVDVEVEGVFPPPLELKIVMEDGMIIISWESPETAKEFVEFNIYMDNVLLATTVETTYTMEIVLGKHIYCVSAVYDDGESIKICEEVESILCAPPTNFEQVDIEDPQEYIISLQWEAPQEETSGDLKEYQLYRDEELIKTLGKNVTTYDDLMTEYTEDPFFYRVVAVFTDECEMSTETIECYLKEIVKGIGKTESENFSIYPNPGSDFINIEMKSACLGASIEIYNSAGILVMKQEANDRLMRLDISTLSNGMYVIKIGEAAKKIVKQ